MLTAVLIVELALLAQPAGESTVRSNEAQERPYWLETAKSHIAECEVFPTDDPPKPFTLHPQPVFHHIQSTRGKSVGSVFLFVDSGGRPAAVGDVFLFPKEKQHQLYNEWHSLADVPLTVRWSGSPLMASGRPGISWSAVPESPAAAAKRPARERQLREIARRFSGHLINREKDKYELRLLTTPLYQYHADDDAAGEAKFLGGGLFALCQETDPEIFLLIEARRGEAGPAWYYAAAEFSNLSLFLALDGKRVWSADPPRFSSTGPHFGGKLKDVDLAAPAAP
jgi:hypothetical protein